MEIRNRLFPYPVLCDETDDYIEGFFDVEMISMESMNNLELTFDFKLENDDLENLIRKGQAKYVIHLECRYTSYRKVIKTDLKEIQCSIPKSRVNKEIDIVAMIVATTEIEGYYSSLLNEDYLGEEINFEHAAILAYENMPKILISKNYEELAGNESLFSIIRVEYPDPDEEHPLDIVLNDDRIKIRVDANTYDSYIKFQQSSAIAMSMFVLPALLFMIDAVREDESCSAYESKNWYMKMKQYYKSQGRDLENELIGEARKNALELAQEMLKNPIGKAYKELMEMEG